MADQYIAAGIVIDLAQKKKGNLKSLCYKSTFPNKRKLYALVCQTLKYRKIIRTLLDSLHFDETKSKIDENLQLVTVYEMLFGKGIDVDGEIGNFAELYEKELTSKLLELQHSNDSITTSIADPVALPRYVRINGLKASKSDIIDVFEKEGFHFKSELTGDCDKKFFTFDEHIPDLLVFHQGTDLHNHPLYKNGQIHLQDKASCLPAFLLQPRQNATVIDACAAPGNKTTHLASIMQNQGKIYAFDLDAKRLTILNKQIRKSGAKNIESKHQDFLKINPHDKLYKRVQYILLDPSCSGSGMVSRMDKLLDEECEDQDKLTKRLEALSKFQYAMLCHALSFPQVEKVSYSTCSVHQQENEDVVERVLSRYGDRFSLVHLLPSWKHRGLPTFEEGFKCLRASPEKDHTNGFFVAVFMKRKQEMNKEDDWKNSKSGNGQEQKRKKRKKNMTEGCEKVPLKKEFTEKQLNGHNNLNENENTKSRNPKRRRRKIMRKPVTFK